MMFGSEMLQGLRPRTSPQARQAFVKLVTNADYAMGAVALARSILGTYTKADVVVLHTESVDECDLLPLETLGCRLIEVQHLPLSDEFNERHARGNLHSAAPFTKGRKPSFHSPLDNFCKLRLWQLIDYDTCVFIDADALVLRNVDRLFDYPEFSAAPNVYESLADFHRLNSGVFVAQPSLATFNDMLKMLDGPGVFWRRTDQTFLETFFPDWHGLPIFMNMLQYVWFTMPALWNWNSISILHYQYEKPWEQNHPRAEALKPLIDLWHRVYRGDDLPDLATFANPKEAA